MTAPRALPDTKTLLQVCDSTWPPASATQHGAWTIREGQGGGQRVSSATENWPTTEADLHIAEAAMRALGQDLIFQIRPGEEALDEMLAHHGYDIVDPVNIYAIPIEEMLVEKAPLVSGFQIWPPLAIMTELWEEAGINAGRRAVMERAPMPKTALFGRSDDQPAGVAFVAVQGGIAMLHALEVVPALRRLGTARNILLTAAAWAAENGAEVFSLIVTKGNHAANPLYASLGMRLVGHYNYRKKLTPG
ncbi:MAG: GNAT family N-acetyltransferase [Rhodobacteraceae bacterium]|nr:GNAT family N-acetyltransferase [Paracoccaceae bacterium]